MRLLVAAGLAGVCLATSPLYAADLFDSAPPPMSVPMDQTELGSNWYIRGDVGYGVIDQAAVVPSAGLFPVQQSFALDPTIKFNGAPIGDANSPVNVTRGNAQSNVAPVFGLGFGYRVNDWLRLEADYSFFHGPGFGAQTQVYCPGQAAAVSNYTYATPIATTGTAVPVGYTYDWSTCNGYLNMTQYNNMGMAMAYVDLGHWGLFSPYLGAGFGLNANTISGTMNYYNSNTGTVYNGPAVLGSAPATWVVDSGQVDQGNQKIYVPLVNSAGKGPQMMIAPQNWYRTINQTKFTFAAQLAAGVGIKISESGTLDLGYHLTTTDITGGVKGVMQSLNVGVRYNLN